MARATTYNKIMESAVHAINDELGLKCELTENSKSDKHYFVLHLQYKDNNGEWQYKGTMGSTAIRFQLDDTIAKYIADSLSTALTAQKKFNSSKGKAQTQSFDVNALNVLTDEQKAALLQALLGTAKSQQTPQQTTQHTDNEPVINLANLLNSTKKNTKKK